MSGKRDVKPVVRRSHTTLWALLTLIVIALLMFSAPGFATSKGAVHQDTLNDPRIAKQLLAPKAMARLYSYGGDQISWEPRRLDQLVRAIQQSQEHGLEPADYHLEKLKSKRLSDRELAIWASDAYLALAAHLLEGKLDPVSIEPDWTAARRSKDLVAYLQNAVANDNIAASLLALAPKQPRYKKLQAAYMKYRNLARQEGWGAVPSGPLLKPGSVSDRVPALRRRLATTGDVSPPNLDSEQFDLELVEAVKRFQRRTNLEPDGVVGPATLRQLNYTVEDRVQQIKVNLERWRWLPEDLGTKHIKVNIADYRLETVEQGKIIATHDVVVGRTYRQTPVFSAQMSYLVLNPWWEVPPKLAKLDILPKLQKDATVVDIMGYQFVDPQGRVVEASSINWNELKGNNLPFRFRQMPGPKNALGKVKFMFPNQHNVYLHDTAAPELFFKTRRDFSSGCIRVRDAVDLINWVMRDASEWPQGKIVDTIVSGRETRVNLQAKLPVHLLYWTAVVDDLGDDIRFVEDIYDRDSRLLSKLDEKPSQK